MFLWLLLPILTVALVYVSLLLQLKRQLHMLQQNSYRIERYYSWYHTQKNMRSQTPFMLIDLLMGLGLPWLVEAVGAVALLLPIVYFSVRIVQEVRRKSKKPLVFTKRAVRIYAVSILIVTLLAGFFVGLSAFVVEGHPLPTLQVESLVYAHLLTPLWLLLALWLLRPVEARINRFYYKDAQRILSEMPDLKIIGITGSYGKTSVKHFLTRILSERYNTLMTPGSYNTLMGVILTVRNHLKPIHQVFVCEMGAKQIGDVAEIMELVRGTQYSILTAVGPQHLDTFGSIENVQKGKFEIVDYLHAGGTAFLNIDYEKVANGPRRQDVRIVTYGVQNQTGDYWADDVRYSAKGMSFDVYRHGERLLTLETKLLGEANVSNLLVATGMALDFGVEPRQIKVAVRSMPAVKHRLEVKRSPGGLTVIDDAFNSNPQGAAMALEVLRRIEGRKKIIITPGMIELGDEAYSLNKAFGEQIADSADYAILVGKKQTEPIQDGLRARSYPEERLFVAQNLREAQARLRSFAQGGDVVLYENDLPDTYES